MHGRGEVFIQDEVQAFGFPIGGFEGSFNGDAQGSNGENAAKELTDRDMTVSVSKGVVSNLVYAESPHSPGSAVMQYEMEDPILGSLMGAGGALGELVKG